MESWVKWCNENEGFVTAILTLLIALLTLIYVIVTIVIACFNKRLAKTSVKNLELISTLEKQRTRPYIIFNIFAVYGESRIVVTQIKNYGLTAAYNVNVEIAPNLSIVGVEDRVNDEISNTIIKFVPPNYEIMNHLGNSADFRAKYENTVFKGQVKYEDISKTKYEEKFEINLLDLMRVTTRTETRTYSLEEMFSNFDEQIKKDE